MPGHQLLPLVDGQTLRIGEIPPLHVSTSSFSASLFGRLDVWIVWIRLDDFAGDWIKMDPSL